MVYGDGSTERENEEPVDVKRRLTLTNSVKFVER